MALVTYIEPNGAQRNVDVTEGDSVMQGALNNMVKGIVGECGGGLACATCHCYVDDAWVDRLDPPSAMEKEMLDVVTCERKASSRLSCQIIVRKELEGLVVHLPESQF